jgi:phage gp45-like
MSRSAITRGKVLSVVTEGGRALVDIGMLSGETRSRIELMMPTGVSAMPAVGADLVVFEIGSRDHLVAIMADDPGLRIPGLAPGEIGIRDAAGQQVVLRGDGVEISGALKVTILTAGEVLINAPVIRLGLGATLPVKLADDSPATKVFGI